MRGRHQGLPPAAQRILSSTSVLPKVDDFTLVLAQCLLLCRSIHVRGKGCAHDTKTCSRVRVFPYLPGRTQVTDKGNSPWQTGSGPILNSA